MGYKQIFTTPSAPIAQLKVFGYDGDDTITISDNVSLPAVLMGGRGGDYIAGGGGGPYGLQQTLGATLRANTIYTLKVDVGNIASGNDGGGTAYNLNGFPGYRVELLAGGTVLKQDDNALAATLAEGTFAVSIVTFTTGAATAELNQPLGTRLVNLNVVDAGAPAADLEVDFDNVRLDAVTTVPEPTGLLPVAVTVASLALARGQRGAGGAALVPVTGATDNPAERSTGVKMSP